MTDVTILIEGCPKINLSIKNTRQSWKEIFLHAAERLFLERQEVILKLWGIEPMCIESTRICDHLRDKYGHEIFNDLDALEDALKKEKSDAV